MTSHNLKEMQMNPHPLIPVTHNLCVCVYQDDFVILEKLLNATLRVLLINILPWFLTVTALSGTAFRCWVINYCIQQDFRPAVADWDERFSEGIHLDSISLTELSVEVSAASPPQDLWCHWKIKIPASDQEE